MDLAIVSTKCYLFASTGCGFRIKIVYHNILTTTCKCFFDIHSARDEATGKTKPKIFVSDRATDIPSPLSKL